MLRRLLAGSALQGAQTLLEGVVSLLMLPFLVQQLGDRFYGMWILVMSIVGYLGFLHFGLGSAVQRTLSQDLARKDYPGASTTLSTALVMFSGAAAAGVVASVAVAAAGRIVIADASEAASFAIVALVMGLRIALSFPSLAFVGVLFAKLRHDVKSVIGISATLARAGLIFGLVRGEPGIVTLAAISAGVDILAVVITIVWARRLAPECEISLRRFRRRTAVELLTYGGFAFLNWVADRLRFSVDNFVISGSLGLSLVTAYTIPVRLVSEANNLMVTMLGNLTPVFAAREANADLDRLRRDFLMASELSVLFGMLAAGGLAIFGSDFIRLWVGSLRDDMQGVLYAYCAMTAVATTQTPSVGLLYAINRHRYFATLTLIEGLANLILSLALVKWFGIVGVAIGTVLPMLITKLAFQPRYVCRQVGIAAPVYYGLLLRGIGIGCLLVAAYAWTAARLSAGLDSWIRLLGGIAAYCAFFLTLYAFFGLTSPAREFVARRILRLKIRTKACQDLPREP